jgi:hypothetical protein
MGGMDGVCKMAQRVQSAFEADAPKIDAVT